MQRLIIAILLLTTLLSSCRHNRLDVDVSDVHVKDFTIDRLEQDMFDYKSGNIEPLISNLKKKYGGFYTSLQQTINGPQMEATVSDEEMLKSFLLDKDMNEAYNECKKNYPDLKQLHDDLTLLFKHYSYHFPGKTTPRVVTFMSGFNLHFMHVDSTMGIGLEMYLGSENKFYQMIQFPKYKTKNMRKEYMVSDFARAWMMVKYPKTDNKKDLLSDMIYNGKIFYLVDALMPAENDSIKTGFSKSQLKWCIDNEYNMWATLIEKKLLFSSDQTETIKFIGEGPFTSSFSRESPARTGIWLGWRIVKQYMDNHPEITLEQLMKNTNYQEILSKSKYKPK